MLEPLATQLNWSDRISINSPSHFPSIASSFRQPPPPLSPPSLSVYPKYLQFSSSFQHCDFGCVLAVLSSGEEKFICAHFPMTLSVLIQIACIASRFIRAFLFCRTIKNTPFRHTSNSIFGRMITSESA